MALIKSIISFYRDGFRAMVLGRTLWKIVLVKLVIIMVVVKILLCPDYLHTHFASDRERAAQVLTALTGESRP